MNPVLPSVIDPDAQIWIVRVPASVSLADLATLVSKKGTMSLKKGADKYVMSPAAVDSDSSDLAAISCFISTSSGLVKAKNTTAYTLMPIKNIPTLEEMKRAGEAVLNAPYTPRTQPDMKVRWVPAGSKQDTEFINKRRKIAQ